MIVNGMTGILSRKVSGNSDSSTHHENGNISLRPAPSFVGSCGYGDIYNNYENTIPMSVVMQNSALKPENKKVSKNGGETKPKNVHPVKTSNRVGHNTKAKAHAALAFTLIGAAASIGAAIPTCGVSLLMGAVILGFANAGAIAMYGGSAHVIGGPEKLINNKRKSIEPEPGNNDTKDNKSLKIPSHRDRDIGEDQKIVEPEKKYNGKIPKNVNSHNNINSNNHIVNSHNNINSNNHIVNVNVNNVNIDNSKHVTVSNNIYLCATLGDNLKGNDIPELSKYYTPQNTQSDNVNAEGQRNNINLQELAGHFEGIEQQIKQDEASSKVLEVIDAFNKARGSSQLRCERVELSGPGLMEGAHAFVYGFGDNAETVTPGLESGAAVPAQDGSEVNNSELLESTSASPSNPSVVGADDESGVQMRPKKPSSRALSSQVSLSQNHTNVSDSSREGLSETGGDPITPETVTPGLESGAAVPAQDGSEVNNSELLESTSASPSNPSVVGADDESGVQMRPKKPSSRALSSQVSLSQNHTNVSDSSREGLSETGGDPITPETGHAGANRTRWARSYIDIDSESKTVFLTHNRLWDLSPHKDSRRSTSEYKPFDVSKLKSEA